MKDIKITIFTPQDLNHSSFMQTAFFELEKKGVIECKVKPDLRLKPGRYSVHEDGSVSESNHQQPKTSYYLYENLKTENKVFFAADLYDVSNHFSSFAFEHCDVIFKRNYISKYVDKLSYSYKVKPVGLTFGCQSRLRNSWLLLVSCYVVLEFKSNLKLDRKILQRFFFTIKKIKTHLKYVTKGREIDKIRSFNKETKCQVFYQVRCFPNTKANYVKEVNDERALLVQLLNRNLGKKYKGGLVPDEISRTYYPDELTNLSTDPDDYLNYIKESSICIYTKGLQNSPARKLAEYLSQGKCIVSERIETELPYELEDGKHIFYFDDINQCIDICKNLLNNKNLIEEVSTNARKYYEDYLDPISVGKSILNQLGNNV
jgi:glycosyltransferase involved in cell wall biosynthesis